MKRSEIARLAFWMIGFLLITAQPAPADVIIDNGAAGTSETGTWLISGGLFPYGTGSVYGSGGASYTWQADLPPGRYDVFAWWTEFSNRSTAAPYTVQYSGGSQTVSANQRINGGQWNYLGTFNFGSQSPATVILNAPSPYPSTYSADAVRFVPNTSPPTPPISSQEEHIYACFAYGPYYSYEGFPDLYFIWQIQQTLGAYNIGGNVWLYQTGSKKYYIHVVLDMAGAIEGLKTPGATVLIYGHANYGLGPVFSDDRDEIRAQSISNIRYIDDPRIFNISSVMENADVYELINVQAYPNWWTDYQDGTSGIMPYVFGDPRGDPPYNYYITYQVPGDPTVYKIETAENSALERFPGCGRPGWYSSSGALPNPADNPEYYIINANGDPASASPHYDGRTIVKRKALEIAPEDMKYSRMFYLACFSGVYFTDTFKRGVMFYTLNNMSLHGGDAFFQYVKAYTEGKSDYEIWQMLQGMQAIFDYYDFSKAPGDDADADTGTETPPTVSSFSQSYGVPQTFTTVFTDEQGADNIVDAYVVLREDLFSLSNAIVLCYDRSGTLYLANNPGTGWAGSCIPGSPKIISNSQGTLNCAQTTITSSGTDLTINWSIMPSASFAGSKNIYLFAVDGAGLNSGTIQEGSWSISPVWIARTPPAYYPTVRAAYLVAVNGDLIQALAGTFIEDLLFGRNVSIALQGGSGSGSPDDPSFSVIKGSFTISHGTVVVQNVIIQ